MWATSIIRNGEIGHHVALSPIGGKVAFVSGLSHKSMRGALFNQGTIDDVLERKRAALAKQLPYPIANYYVVLTDSSSSASAPPRVEPLPLDEGPHRAYAIQWFSFAAISIIGLVIFIRRT